MGGAGPVGLGAVGDGKGARGDADLLVQKEVAAGGVLDLCLKVVVGGRTNQVPRSSC